MGMKKGDTAATHRDRVFLLDPYASHISLCHSSAVFPNIPTRSFQTIVLLQTCNPVPFAKHATPIIITMAHAILLFVFYFKREDYRFFLLFPLLLIAGVRITARVLTTLTLYIIRRSNNKTERQRDHEALSVRIKRANPRITPLSLLENGCLSTRTRFQTWECGYRISVYHKKGARALIAEYVVQNGKCERISKLRLQHSNE